MEDIGAIVNGDASAPTLDSDEYNLFSKALNSAERKWGAVDYNWEILRDIHRTTVPQSGTSVAIPDSLIKLSGYVDIGGNYYTEIRPQDVPSQSMDSQYVVLDRRNGYMTINPASATELSVTVPFHSKVTTLATSTAIPLCPSEEYLVKEASAYILFGRSDGRYVELRDDASELLQQMVGQEVSKLQQFDSTIKTGITNKGFTLGADV